MERITGNELSLDAAFLSAITRLQVFYESPQGAVSKPFYLYRAPQQVEVVHEKEWFYFSRFGCDVPLGVDFSEAATYDRDLDGLPDKEDSFLQPGSPGPMTGTRTESRTWRTAFLLSVGIAALAW